MDHTSLIVWPTVVDEVPRFARDDTILTSLILRCVTFQFLRKVGWNVSDD
jgi:hypothetical protein